MKKSKVKGQSFKFLIVFLPICFLLFSLLGCETIKEGTRGLLGISTKVLKEGRKNAVKKTFNYDHNTCYIRVKEALKAKGCYIYAADKAKKMIAVYLSEQDTTPVGIFFKDIDASHTQIQVSSPSTFAKDFISISLFSALEEKKE